MNMKDMADRIARLEGAFRVVIDTYNGDGICLTGYMEDILSEGNAGNFTRLVKELNNDLG